MNLFIAFALGLFGSLHCAGMCGPIALAISSKKSCSNSKMQEGLLYNMGRICTYGFMGFGFGLFGYSLQLAGIQQSLSVAIGLVMLLSLLIPSRYFGTYKVHSKAFYIVNWVKKNLSGLLVSSHPLSNFLTGLLNGLLPCGLVYIALGGAIATQNAFLGGIYMLLFGLGTLPIMLGLSVATKFLSFKTRLSLLKFKPVVVFSVGLLFVLRGLNLGIPYVSPSVDSCKQKMTCCHKD